MTEHQDEYFTDQLARFPYYGPHGKTMTSNGMTITIESHEPAAAADLLPCPWCGTAEHLFYELGAVECGACGARGPTNALERVARAEWNRQATAAAASHASLIAFVDDLLDLLQDVGGMSAAWCETELRKLETLLRGQ